MTISEELKCAVIKVGANMLSLVSQTYLARAYSDGRVPAVYVSAPYLVLGGEGYYAVPVDTEVYGYLSKDDGDDVIIENDYIEEEVVEVDEKDLAYISKLLDKLGELGEHADVLMADLDKRERNEFYQVFGDDGLTTYDAIKAKYDAYRKETSAILEADTEALKDQVTQRVIAVGATVKGTTHQAVFNAGRVGWNTKGLEGYALAHRALLQFRKVGKPYVSFRKVAGVK